MSFPRYPKYKASGVEWLGDVPEHWQVTPLKHLADVKTGVAKGKDNEGRNTIAVPYLRVANVQDGYLDLDDVASIEIPIGDLKRYCLKPGDVLMNEGGDFDKLGRGHVWDGQIDPCITQNHVFAVRPHKVSSVWLNAITSSEFARFYFMSRSKQSTNLASISSTNLMELPVILPPPPEQTRIAAFLDQETAKIDALVAEQRRLMELLKEKRQAVISHAVTRGLNPDAPLKPSGIEWLGDVPGHWEISPLKWLTDQDRQIMYGIVLPGPDVGEGIPILKGGNVKRSRMNLESMSRTTAEIEAPYARARLKEGDLVYSIRGTIGDCEPVPTEMTGSNITQDVARVAPADGVCAPWLRWALLSSAVREDLACGSLGAAVRGINIFDLKRAAIPTPPLPEQVAIAEFLARETTEFETLTAEAQRAVDPLQERRTALISAAVTGQIDVRDHAKAEAVTTARRRARRCWRAFVTNSTSAERWMCCATASSCSD